MKGRLPFVAILGGSLAFLVSLYFIWVTQNSASCSHPGSGSGSGLSGLLCLLSGTGQLDGWGYFGQVAAVLAIALAGAALAALARPQLASRLPIGKAALALGIFALLTLAYLWGLAVDASQRGPGHFTAGLAPAAYVGLAGVGVVCGAAAAVRWGEIANVPSPLTAVGQLLTLGVVASFLLPAFNSQRWSEPGLGLELFICAFACSGLPAWSRAGKPGERLAIAAAIATLVAGYLLPGRSIYTQWPYELWLLVGCTASLLALSLLGSRGLRLHRPTAPTDAAVVAAVGLLLVSMFLPWQTQCSQGTCYSGSGWTQSSFGGAFVLVLLVAFVSLRRFLWEFAIGAAIFVAASGLAATEFGGHLRYGALLGFAGAALLLLFALPRLRPIAGRRFLVRLLPEIAALGLLFFSAAPLFGRTTNFAFQSPWRWLVLLTTAVILVTLRVLLRWCGEPSEHAEIVLLPLGLLAATALDLVYAGTTAYDGRISWEGWASLFLCLLLVGCGWIERYGGGLERFQIPEEIWRVDRLPGAEN